MGGIKFKKRKKPESVSDLNNASPIFPFTAEFLTFLHSAEVKKRQDKKSRNSKVREISGTWVVGEMMKQVSLTVKTLYSGPAPVSTPDTHTQTHTHTLHYPIWHHLMTIYRRSPALLLVSRHTFSGLKWIFPELIEKHNLKSKRINILLAHFTVSWWGGTELSSGAGNSIWKKLVASWKLCRGTLIHPDNSV